MKDNVRKGSNHSRGHSASRSSTHRGDRSTGSANRSSSRGSIKSK